MTYTVEYIDTDGKTRVTEVTTQDERLIPFHLRRRDRRFFKILKTTAKGAE
jgi:hypothetical protein